MDIQVPRDNHKVWDPLGTDKQHYERQTCRSTKIGQSISRTQDSLTTQAWARDPRVLLTTLEAEYHRLIPGRCRTDQPVGLPRQAIAINSDTRGMTDTLKPQAWGTDYPTHGTKADSLLPQSVTQ